MLSLPPSVRIFVAQEPVDMRKSFYGLSGIVRDLLHEDPLSGHLFVFFNKRRNLVKVLWWDRSGFWILYKKLERGTFAPLKIDGASSSSCVRMRASELALILDGLDLEDAKRRAHYDYVRDSA